MKRIPLFCLSYGPGAFWTNERRAIWNQCEQIVTSVRICEPAARYRVLVERTNYGFLATVWAEER